MACGTPTQPVGFISWQRTRHPPLWIAAKLTTQHLATAMDLSQLPQQQAALAFLQGTIQLHTIQPQIRGVHLAQALQTAQALPVPMAIKQPSP